MPLILLMIGLVMIIYNYRGIKKGNEVHQDNDSLNISFQSVLQDSKEELNDYKIEIGLLRRDIAESLTELQEEIIDIKNNLNRLKNYGERYENKEDLENKYFLNINEIHSDINNDYNQINDIKVEKINKIDQIIGESGEKLFFDHDMKEETVYAIDFSDNVDSSKTKSIKKLLKDGLKEEEICRKLSVSKGEVLLVKNLFEK